MTHYQRIDWLIRQGRLPEAKRLQREEADRVLPADKPLDEPYDGPAFIELLRAGFRIQQATGVLN